ncbi:hypothetical protein ACQ4PT_050116 [Festuca glaucescens]
MAVLLSSFSPSRASRAIATGAATTSFTPQDPQSWATGAATTSFAATCAATGSSSPQDPRLRIYRSRSPSQALRCPISVTISFAGPTQGEERQEDTSNARDEIDQLLLDGFDMYNRSSLHSEKEEGSEDDSEDEDVESYKRGMTNAAFEDMLTLFREALPEGHSLPKKFHEAKQYIRGVGLAYDTYDAYFNDCIIFRGIHAKANVCPVCKTSRWKTERSVVGHRRFLSRDHAFRSDEESFDGTTDFREPPVQPTGEEISAMTMDIQTAYGKLQKQKRIGRKKRNRVEGQEDVENKEEVHTVESTFKKRSIFFQLEYWKFLLVIHNLDSMHIEKNVFDNVVNTLLDVDKRSKDNAKARMDMKRMKIREHLHIDETQEKPDLPDAVYYMESSKKKLFCGLVKNVRFPDNHASSMFNKVRLEENKFVGLKTHDCHIFFEEILPLAVMKTLPEEVALPLIKLAKCFKVITSKIVSNKEIAIVEEQLPEILCQLEKIFPPTFFDIMEHLVIHLPTEVRLVGPVQFRNMWSTEMFIGNMKNWICG